MSSKRKITAKEFARTRGFSSRAHFVVGRLYDKEDKRTQSKWEEQMINDKLIDAPIKQEKESQVEKNDEKQLESE